jgi:hypothetical protein
MTVTVDAVIKKYMKLREKKALVEATIKEELDKIKADMTKLEAFLKAKLDADGLTSFKTEYGTAFLTTTDFANVDDWDAVLRFIREEEAYDMLEKRVSKTAVRGYIEANKEVPPGIKYGTKLDINVRKPTAR